MCKVELWSQGKTRWGLGEMGAKQKLSFSPHYFSFIQTNLEINQQTTQAMGVFELWLKIYDKHCQIKKKTAKYT